jgi:MSHA pilin protein MshA
MRIVRNEKGFTLIELVMIIVIIAILSAIAIPRYVDMTDKAEEATMKSLTGALRASAAINYANCVLRGTATGGINITSVFNGLQEAGDLTVSNATYLSAPINARTYYWQFTGPTTVAEGTSTAP